MRQRLEPLRVACLPFVTRALRGPRRRRFALGSGLLALLVLLVGVWVGQSASPAARDMRVGFGFERDHWERERSEFAIIVDERRTYDDLTRQLAQGNTEPWGPLRYTVEEGWMLLDSVAGPHVVPPRHLQALQQRARELRNARVDLAPSDLDERRRYLHFDWNDSRDLERLRAVLDAQLVPKVELYRSPLDLPATVRLVGGFAGGILLVMMLVLAPLWVGAQLAQELHENTLQPLTGTALTARQLVLGLVAGALAPLVIVGVPLLAIHLLAALSVGQIVPALGFVLITVAMGAMLTGLSMLIALAQGRQRSPGIVGILLLAALGTALGVGMGVGLNLEPQVTGAVDIIPAVGPVHLLTETFFPVNHLTFDAAFELDLRMVLATVGAAVLALLTGRAIERRVGGTHQHGALTPVEAAVAALMLVLLAVAALPVHHHFGETFLAATAVVMLPLMLVLAGRVPGGDMPPGMRRVPVGALLREVALWIGMVLVVSLLIEGGPTEVRPGAIFGVMHLLWAILVTALVTLRSTALPTSIPAKLWLMVCLVFVLIEYGTGVMWCMDRPDAELLFPLGAIHTVLWLVHMGMFLFIPVSLLQALAPKAAATTAAVGATAEPVEPPTPGDV